MRPWRSPRPRSNFGVGQQRRQLALLAVALVLAMSTWFSTAAVLNELRASWDLSRSEASWLTIVVQLGFVVGAVVSATLGLADRIAPRNLIFLGALGAALANGSIVVADSFGFAVVARGLTGAFLAAVYPPALKAMSSWYRAGRGTALGVMIAALTLGSAMPHLVNGLGGLDWKLTLVVASGLTVAGGDIARRWGVDGPHLTSSPTFEAGHVATVVADRTFRFASLGYFGHMWELYAMWAWMAAFYGDVFDSPRAASLAAFVVIGAGAAGSIHVGIMSDGLIHDGVSRSGAARLAMRWSASAAIVIGFLLEAPWPVVLGVGLVWGYWVVADSAQFSTIVSETCDTRFVGTALTLQVAIGFILTVFTIFLVPVVNDAHGWGWAFLLLAPGPLLGSWAMGRIDPDSRRTATVG